MNKTAFAAAVAVTALLTGAATAAPAGRSVAYGDLNLASAASAKHFDARVRAAARSVCGSADTRDLVATRIVARCVDSTVAATKRAATA